MIQYPNPAENIRPDQLDNEFHPRNIFCPRSAGSSQLAAVIVIAAAAGHDFVILCAFLSKILIVTFARFLCRGTVPAQTKSRPSCSAMEVFHNLRSRSSNVIVASHFHFVVTYVPYVPEQGYPFLFLWGLRVPSISLRLNCFPQNVQR